MSKGLREFIRKFAPPHDSTIRFTAEEAKEIWEKFGDKRVGSQTDTSNYYEEVRDMKEGESKKFDTYYAAKKFSNALNNACRRLPYRSSLRHLDNGTCEVMKVSAPPDPLSERFLRKYLPHTVPTLKKKAAEEGLSWYSILRTSYIMGVVRVSRGFGQERVFSWRFKS